MSLADADTVVRAILTDPALGAGVFTPEQTMDDLGGRELVAGILYGYSLIDNDDRPIDMTVYLGLGELGGALWDQETRVLQRVSGLSHQALPELVDGGHVPKSDPGESPRVGAGFVRTRAYGRVGTDFDYLPTFFGAHKAKALQQIWLLAEALGVLHNAAITHRNLWPGTIDVSFDENLEDVDGVRITRFEMSTMLANLLRAGRSRAAGREQIREFYLGQDPRSLCYTPPERIRWLLREDDIGGIGGPAGDVFGLGMVAAEWLLGTDLFAAAEIGDEAAADAFHEQVRRRLNVTTELPLALAHLLRDMLDPREAGRPTMSEVVDRLGRGLDDFIEVLEPTQRELPFLVAFMRAESDRTLLSWGLISDSGTTENGKQQLTELIEADLRGAAIGFSPDGAKGYIPAGSANDKRMDEAKVVLFGRNLIWFASRLEGKRGVRPVPFENIYVLRFVRRATLPSTPLSALRARAVRPVGFAVEAVPHNLPVGRLEQHERGRPLWSTVIAAAKRQEPGLRARAREYLEAFEWLLQYRATLRTAREYAFVVEPAEAVGVGVTALRWDRGTEELRSHNAKSPMLAMMRSSTKIRPSLGDFLELAEDETGLGGVTIEILYDRDGRPDYQGVAGNFALVDVRGETIVVQSYAGKSVPPRGWLRLSSDAASSHDEWRQDLAVKELARNRTLLSKLVRPSGIRAPKERWSWAGGKLVGEGRDAVVQMLCNEPIFAIQGPPGTGKTAVASEAVAAYLSVQSGDRVLVSAQSHDALDHLATRIVDRLGMVDGAGHYRKSDWLAVRVGSNFAMQNKVMNGPMREFTLDVLVPAIKRQIATGLSLRATRVLDNPKLAAVLREWRDAVERSDFELRLRVRRSANIVFATTGASTEERLMEMGSGEPFEWVIVEEAAKAWPTELAMPLVHGLRWGLVGDHAQIGAFGREEVVQFLELCRDDPDEEVSTWHENRDTYIRAFDLFATMFAERTPGAPLMQLTQQRRMQRPIADVVSAAFYAREDGTGALETCTTTTDHGLLQPDWLCGRSLIWLDTEQTQQCQGYWSNDAEVDIVTALVRRILPDLGRAGGPAETLAVLTPYRHQVAALNAAMPECISHIHTVDSFQGQEADVVVVSLVRDRARPGFAPASIGYLADPARANVLLSRARNLLVLVGRLQLFEECDSPHWRTVVRTVREVGAVVKLSETGLL